MQTIVYRYDILFQVSSSLYLEYFYPSVLANVPWALYGHYIHNSHRKFMAILVGSTPVDGGHNKLFTHNVMQHMETVTLEEIANNALNIIFQEVSQEK